MRLGSVGLWLLAFELVELAGEHDNGLGEDLKGVHDSLGEVVEREALVWRLARDDRVPPGLDCAAGAGEVFEDLALERSRIGHGGDPSCCAASGQAMSRWAACG